MTYQPETTHIDPNGIIAHEYSCQNGVWKFWDDPSKEWFDDVNGGEWRQEHLTPIKQIKSCSDNAEVTSGGGSCNYYMVDVKRPTTLPEPYTIECNDIIEALGLSFKEANIIKEIFRTANERTNDNGKSGNTEKRAAEKVLFFAIRHAVSSGVNVESFIQEINLK